MSFNLHILILSALLLPPVIAPSRAFAVDATSGTKMVRLHGHLLPMQLAKATRLGRVVSEEQVSLSIPLKVRDEVALANLINAQHTPGNPLYGKFLTPAEFADAFSPSQEDYDRVAHYLESRGLVVTTRSPNRLLISVAGQANDVELAFGLELQRYKAADGRVVRSPSAEPAIDSEIAPHIAGVVGLSTFARGHHNFKFGPLVGQGTGPSGGFSPADIKKAYGLTSVTADGTGESVALVEFDGYTASDITKYATQFSLGSVPTLQNVLLDGFNGAPTTGANSGAIEVTLDIELVFALAPKLSKIIVYEAPTGSTIHSFDTAFVDILNRIATDNSARQVSISWGASEGETEAAALASENTVFMQMAAQGQAVFVASGDTGANDNGIALAVDNPSTQPYVVAVGGTKLRLNSDGTYASETTWAYTSDSSGGGGGISKHWPIPKFQSTLPASANLGSTTMRMIPDVSLNADPNTGYSIAFNNAFGVVGGTSCSAPLWAAFNALVNQKRLAGGLSGIGNPNPAYYRLGQSSVYAQTFADIADLSTNLHYPAVAGYDLGTGWGSFKGMALFNALTSSLLPPMAPTSLKATVSP